MIPVKSEIELIEDLRMEWDKDGNDEINDMDSDEVKDALLIWFEMYLKKVQIIQDVKIRQYKEDFRKAVKGIPPELNKEKTLNQVDFIMWGLFDNLFASQDTSEVQE